MGFSFKPTMKRIVFLFFLTTTVFTSNAQSIRVYEHIGLSIATANKVTVPSIAYTQTLEFGRERSYRIGTGFRLNYFNLKNRTFDGVETKIKQVSITPNPKFNGASVNIPIVAEFHTKKIILGVNIDIIGMSFGKTREGENLKVDNYEGTLDSLNASPRSLSLLLLGKNNRGTLNSELYLGYKVSDELTVRAGISSLSSSFTSRYTPKSGKETTLGRFQTSQIMPFFSLVFNLER